MSTLLERLDSDGATGFDMSPGIPTAREAAKEIRALRSALRELWAGTVWGAGKAAVFEVNKTTMIAAGIPNIGD